MDAHTLYEILGYAASLLVAVSLTMRKILYLRIVNFVGALAFTIYGLLISAYPVAVVNFVIMIINIYYLYGMLSTKEYFRLLHVDPNSQFLSSFLDFHRDDILKFLPDFHYNADEQSLVVLTLRDMMPVGLLAGHQEGDTLAITIDYVIPGYRDFKSGQFIYRDNPQLFTENGIRTLTSLPGSSTHQSYLTRVGFVPQSDGPNARYTKTLG